MNSVKKKKQRDDKGYTMLTLIKRKMEQLAILILDKANFRIRKIIRDKECIT